MDASDWWSWVTGLHPSPRAGGSVASDFLTGKTEEEFPQIHKDGSRDTGQHKMKSGWVVAMVAQECECT